MSASPNMTRVKRRRSYVNEIIAIICVLLASGFLSYSLFGPGGYRDLQESRMELRERQVRVNKLEADVERRTENANAMDEESLKSGRPDALEMLERRAREYGYAREGEYIQHVD